MSLGQLMFLQRLLGGGNGLIAENADQLATRVQHLHGEGEGQGSRERRKGVGRGEWE